MRLHRWIPSGSGYWSYCKLCKIVKRVDGKAEEACRGENETRDDSRNASTGALMAKRKPRVASSLAWADVSLDRPPRMVHVSWYREHLQSNLKHIRVRVVPVRKRKKARG